MKSDTDIASLCKSQRKEGMGGLNDQYNNTLACQEFYNGDTTGYKDKIQFVDDLGRRRRAMVQFSKIQPSIDAVVGFMAQNRSQAKYVAHLNSDEDQVIYSDNMNALSDFHRGNMNADQLETDLDNDMIINGYGAAETDLSYITGHATTDPNGEIVGKRLDPMTVYWDVKAIKRNLLDARYVGYWNDYDLKDALSLFQGSKPEDFELTDASDQSASGYVYNPYGGLYDKIRALSMVEWVDEKADTVRVYNHQWFEYETFYRADNPLYETDDVLEALEIQAKLEIAQSEMEEAEVGPEGAETNDMFGFDPLAQILTMDDKGKRLVLAQFPDLVCVPLKRKCYYTAVVSGTHVFNSFKSISQQGFSIQFKTGNYNAPLKIWVGMVNAMMEPARYFNKALTELMFTIAANSKGGVYVEEEAVEDLAVFSSDYAKTDAVITVRAGTLSNTTGGPKIMDKARPAIPTGLDNIIQLSAQNVMENGVDPAFLGNLKDQDQSGILYKRQIRQCISKIARYFDSATLYQKEWARLMIDLIRVWVQNNNGQWVKVTGSEGKDTFIQVSEDAMAAEYDVTIREAPQTPEDKQETATLLSNMAGQFLTVGDATTGKAFLAESLNFLPGLDGDMRNRLVTMLQPKDQQIDPAQFQAMQEKIQMLQQIIQSGEVEKNQSITALNNVRAEREKALQNKDRADTAKTLEDAAQTGIENDMMREYGTPSEAKMSISA